jgi:hypothetical protein
VLYTVEGFRREIAIAAVVSRPVRFARLFYYNIIPTSGVCSSIIHYVSKYICDVLIGQYIYMRCINRYMYTIYYAMPATDLINWSTSHCIPTFDLGSSVEHARPERHPVIIIIVVVAPIQFIMVPSARTTGPQQPVLFSIVIRSVHYVIHYMLCKLSGPTPPMIFDLYTIAVYLPATRQKLDQCCSSDPRIVL